MQHIRNVSKGSKDNINSVSISVMIRIRPSIKRENGFDKCIESDNNIIRIRSDDLSTKDFEFDKVFDEDASQQDIMEHVGTPLIENIYAGYNCCILAYGQSGSGKTHTMLGSNDQRGLIPNICNTIFDKKRPDVQYQCSISFVEIYAEKLRDLLNPEEKNVGLRQWGANQSPTITNLSEKAVDSAEKALLFLELGNRNRIVHSTNLNDRSSRSHAIFIMNWTQLIEKNGIVNTRSSKIYLVDLAGSEKIAISGVTGVRQDEAIAINSSLSALSRVIFALSKNAKFTNFRDSCLTWLLSDCLGGNSKTTMIANISPSVINNKETLSTLRYAANAKKIKRCVYINENIESKNIKSLEAEIIRLKNELKKSQNDNTSSPESEKLLADELEEAKKLYEQSQISWNDKLKEAETQIELQKLEFKEQIQARERAITEYLAKTEIAHKEFLAGKEKEYKEKLQNEKKIFEAQLLQRNRDSSIVIDDVNSSWRSKCERIQVQYNTLQSQYDIRIREMDQQWEKQFIDKDQEYKLQFEEQTNEHQQKIENLKQKHENDISELKNEYHTKIEQITARFEKDMNVLRSDLQGEYASLRDKIEQEYEYKLQLEIVRHDYEVKQVVQSHNAAYDQLEKDMVKEMEVKICQMRREHDLEIVNLKKLHALDKSKCENEMDKLMTEHEHEKNELRLIHNNEFNVKMAEYESTIKSLQNELISSKLSNTLISNIHSDIKSIKSLVGDKEQWNERMEEQQKEYEDHIKKLEFELLQVGDDDLGLEDVAKSFAELANK
jgi:hypothetical protein